MRYLVLTLVLGAASTIPAHGANGITTTVNRTVNLVADEGDFGLAVTATVDITQQQLTELLQDVGIQNFTVSGTSVAPSSISYQITFTTAAAAMNEYARRLELLRQHPPSGLLYLTFSASLSASQAAVDAARRSALPQLLGDARMRAQQNGCRGEHQLGGSLERIPILDGHLHSAGANIFQRSGWSFLTCLGGLSAARSGQFTVRLFRHGEVRGAVTRGSGLAQQDSGGMKAD